MDRLTSQSQRVEPREVCGIRSVIFSYYRAMLAVLAAISLLLAGCEGATHTASTPTSTPLPPAATPTPPAFSPFHEWRAAYISSHSQLHAVTLDGKNDAAGPYLPNLEDAATWISAGFSPDGHYVAFQAPSLTILDVTRRDNASTPLDPKLLAYTMAWSPQGNTLAVYQGPGNPYVLVDAATGHARVVPGTSSSGETPGSVATLLGWIDATHLAVTLLPSGSSYTDPAGDKFALANPLGSLDITTGAVRLVATIISPPQASTSRFVLSPDGTKALMYNVVWHDEPFMPVVDLIDIATGRVTPLPQIAQTAKPDFTSLMSLVWRPNSDTVVGTGGLLLDLDRDTVTQVNLLDEPFVEAWTPDGKTLIVSSDWQHGVGIGPHTISALTFGPNGQTSLVVLAHDAYIAPFAGFVRTA